MKNDCVAGDAGGASGVSTAAFGAASGAAFGIAASGAAVGIAASGAASGAAFGVAASGAASGVALHRQFPPTSPVVPSAWLAEADAGLAALRAACDAAVSGLRREGHLDHTVGKLLTPDLRASAPIDILRDAVTRLAEEAVRTRPDVTPAALRAKRRRHPFLLDPAHVPTFDERRVLADFRARLQLESPKLAFDLDHCRFVHSQTVNNRLVNVHASLKAEFAASPVPASPVAADEVIVSVAYFHPVRGWRRACFDFLASRHTLADVVDATPCEEDYTEYAPMLPFRCLLLSGWLFVDKDEGGDDAIGAAGGAGGEATDGARSFAYPANSSPNSPRNRAALSDSKAMANADLLITHMKRANNPHLFRTEPLRFLQDAKLGSLECQILRRGAYLHRGDCEHRIVIYAMRKFDPRFDFEYTHAYPVRTYQPSANVTLCQACLMAPAAKRIFNSHSLPENPTILCIECLDAFAADLANDTDVTIVDFVDVM